MRKRVGGSIVLALLAIICLGACFSKLAWADDTSNDLSNYRLEMSPVSKRVALTSGEEKKENVQVKNTGVFPVMVNVYATEYLIPNGLQEQSIVKDNYVQIAKWITFKGSDGQFHTDLRFKLDPDQSREIPYAICVPEKTVAGGQYAIIYAEFSPIEESEGTIQARSRVGMSLLAYIDGDEVVRGAEIKDVKTTSFAISQKINVSSTVSNTGNVDFQASTDIKVDSIFGKELYHDIVVETILPEEDKAMSATWDDTPAIGLVHLTYKITALDKVSDGDHLVLVMPTGAFGVLIIVLSVVIIVFSHFKRKKYWEKRRLEVLDE